MTRILVTVVCALSIAGCHARRVEPGPGKRTGDDGEQRAEPEEQKRGEGARPERAPRQASEGDDGAEGSDERPPLAVSPAGLMVEEGPRRIQEALNRKGHDVEVTGQLDEATSAAVREFQASQDLARTGVPDQATVRALGLDPDEVFRGGDD